MAVQVQIVDSSLKVHREDQAHQAKVMISVQVTDENMIEPMKVYSLAHQLHLCGLTTIHKERSALHFNELR